MNRTGRQRIDGYMRQMVIHAGRMVIAFGPDIGENLLRIRNRHRVVGAVLFNNLHNRIGRIRIKTFTEITYRFAGDGQDILTLIRLLLRPLVEACFDDIHEKGKA